MKILLERIYEFGENKNGVTLIELLIAACLIVVVLSLSYSIYLFGIQGYINNTSSIENQSNVRIALEHITYSIRRSNNISIGENLVTIGDEYYRLSQDILMNKGNQLATGISEFSVSELNHSLVCIRISSIPDKSGKTFSLEAHYFLRDYREKR